VVVEGQQCCHEIEHVMSTLADDFFGDEGGGEEDDEDNKQAKFFVALL
jgi:hypothetical protein